MSALLIIRMRAKPGAFDTPAFLSPVGATVFFLDFSPILAPASIPGLVPSLSVCVVYSVCTAVLWKQELLAQHTQTCTALIPVVPPELAWTWENKQTLLTQMPRSTQASQVGIQVAGPNLPKSRMMWDGWRRGPGDRRHYILSWDEPGSIPWRGNGTLNILQEMSVACK